MSDLPFSNARETFLARFSKAPAAEISNYPLCDEILDVRDHVEEACKAFDAYLTEIFSEARYMASVGTPKGEITALQDYLNNQSIISAFNRSAAEFPRKREAA